MTTYLRQRTLFPPLIPQRPSPMLGIVVVIPCYDEDFLLLSLMSLKKCARPSCDVEVIVVVNEGENAPPAIREKNSKTFQQATRWAAENSLPHLRFHIFYKNGLPKKHAGVGLARKIGMDEACFRFEKINNPGGIIACFDADSRCDEHYLQALEAHFQKHPKAQACGIYFEHPLSGPDFGDSVYQAITQYELHLRYYVHAQRWAGVPHAWQTIGSSMAVRCDAYQQQGGMNRRQAGEDFYFLHKFIPLGHFSEITATKVIPSPRPSHRVPFGTGRAVGELLRSGGEYLTYAPASFHDLKAFFETVPTLFSVKNGDLPAYLERLPESIRLFLEEQDFGEKLLEIQSNTASAAAFTRRFWRWFDAFLLMKFLHFAREKFHPDVDVVPAARWLAGLPGGDVRDLLLRFRVADRAGEAGVGSGGGGGGAA
jgi:hypothetical protein